MELLDVRVVDNVWVPVGDARLSARLWLPQPRAGGPARFSVVLEYLPYRKSDWTAPRDARNHTWLAQRGLAVARVDVRGSGNSEGHYAGEYTREELQDGVRVIEWLASQPWSSGSVGMFGKSWGGFNGLQIAALAPPALKGVVSLYSIDDRYAEDVHYMGGAVLGSEALSWASIMFAWNSRPPMPEVVGDEQQWRAAYKQRLERQDPWLHEWLAHQPRDEFWKHGSICESYDSVKCPVLAIGGWTDGYYNGIFRMVASMKNCVRKGVIGPWSHEWPNVATPGPQVGFLEMCREWWEYSLNGVQNSAANYPDMQLYVKDAIENPSPQILEYPGNWRAVPDVRDLHQSYLTLQCTESGDIVKTNEPLTSTTERRIKWHPLQGSWGGEWLSFGGEDMPGDQTCDDALATTWTSSTLTEAIEIIGHPEVSFLLKTDKPQSLVMARLCDVSPSGSSTLISRGVLNLSHRNGHAPEDLELMPENEFVRISWKLNSCAYKVPSGHKMALAITSHYWPMVWPSPEPTNLVISFAELNSLKLPLLEQKAEAACPVETYPLDKGTPTRCVTLRDAVPMKRELKVHLSETDASQPGQQLQVIEDEGKSVLVDEGITMEETAVKTYTIDGKGLQPRVSIQRSLTYEKLAPEALSTLLASKGVSSSQDDGVTREDAAEHPVLPWHVKVDTDSSMTSDGASFLLEDHLVVTLNGAPFFEKRWEKRIARDHV